MTQASAVLSPPVSKEASFSEWKQYLWEFEKPSVWRSRWQIVNSFGPVILLWVLMYATLGVSNWLTLGLAALTGTWLMRVFIILHDCGHGSFFESRRANAIVGFIGGVMTFTPYYFWRWKHALHHATSGDLDRRGDGDVWTMTVKEHDDAPSLKRFLYHVNRNPFILLLVFPVLLFLFFQRFPTSKGTPRERHSVWWTNLAIAVKIAVLGSIFGFVPYLLIQTAVMFVAATLGVWMFYVQHQYEDTYWEHHENWDLTAAALQGSSFYKLPRILQWFSGNIGFHHVHHLSSRIPNYYLEKCHNSHPRFREVKPITMLTSINTVFLCLWDEDQRKLISFRQARKHKLLSSQAVKT